ncbi:MAG: CcdB family protein [Gammaproteobacteria bacterium]|nr:CcdB family protein [Gammaproteobacteria bacterium]
MLTTLTPTFEIEAGWYLMMTPQLAGAPKKALGPQVASLSAQRDVIVAALDFLITGI